MGLELCQLASHVRLPKGAPFALKPWGSCYQESLPRQTSKKGNFQCLDSGLTLLSVLSQDQNPTKAVGA